MQENVRSVITSSIDGNASLQLPARSNESLKDSIAINNAKKKFALKRLLFTLIAIFIMLPVFATDYYWVGGAGGSSVNIGDAGTLSLSVGGASLGAITLTSADRLIFDGSDIDGTSGSLTGSTAITCTSSGAITLGQLIFQNTVNVTYSPGSTRTITIGSSMAGTDLDIQAGSTFFDGGTSTSAMTLTLVASNTANVAGTLIVGNSGASQTSTISTSGKYTIANGGTLVYSGTGSISGAIDSTTFSTGSTMIFRGSSSLNTQVILTGRTFYNLSYESSSGSWAPNPTGSTAATVTNLFAIGGNGAGTITSGSSYSGTITAGAITIKSGSTYTPGGNLVINGAFTNNGTFTHNGKTVSFGTGGIIAGSATTTFNNLTINTTNSSDIVWLDSASSTPVGSGIIIIANGGTLSLSKGVFHVGAGNTIQMGTSSATTIDASGGGNFATTGTNGSDGGNIDVRAASGGAFTAKGNGTTGSPTFYNIYDGNTGDANWRLNLSTTGIKINGTLSATTLAGGSSSNGNQWAVQTSSPVWGPNSTFIRNGVGNSYTPGLEWLSISSGTIGTTAGYPNNVMILNVGTSVNNGAGFSPNGSAWSINGTLFIGNSSFSCIAEIARMSSFTCGGIVIDNGSTLKHGTETFTVKGNWLQQGSTIGIFSPNSTTPSDVIFGGNGTSASPQTISISSGVVFFGTGSNFSGVTINNGTYVRLNSPITLGSTRSLTLTSGILQTDPTNILRVTNTSTSAITGTGSSTNMINGPVKWLLLNSGTNTYNFPVGSGTTYLPLSFSSKNTTANDTATVQAFASASGGTPDNSTVDYLDSAVYWSLATSSGLGTTGSTVTLGQPSAISPYNIIAKSTTATGSYTSLGGSVTTNGGTCGDIGTASPWFMTFAHIKVAGTITTGTITGSPFCNGASVSVPFTFTGSLTSFTAQLSDASGSFTSPTTIGTGTSSPINATLPSAIANGSGYRIRVISTSPAVTGSNNSVNLSINGQTISLTSGSASPTVCSGTSITSVVYTIGGTATNASLTSGSFPAGVNGVFSGSTFTISGTPTQSGIFPYTITTSGSSCTGATLSGTITVSAQSITLSSSAGTNAQTVCSNSAITNITYTIGGTATGASVSGLPSGVSGSYGSGTFTISGTPANPGTYNYTVTTSGSSCTAAIATGSIIVNGGPVVYAPPATPLIRYDFTGGTTSDLGSIGNAASLQGSPTTTTDRFGNVNNALSVTASSSQYITNVNAINVGSASVFNSTSNFEPYSQSIWFKVANGYSAGGGLLQFTNNQIGATSANYDHNVWMNTAGNILFGIYNGSNPIIVSPNTYNDGKWHNATTTISSSGTAKLYMDGSQVASSTAFTGNNATGEQYWRVGYTYLNGWPANVTQGSSTYTTAESSVFITGSLDDAALYNVELSAAQVATITSQVTASGSTVCAGSGSTVTVSSYTLASGTYTVTYNVSGTNTVSSTTASMTFTAGSPGTGTFATTALSNAGTANIVNITSLTLNGCTANVSVLSSPFTTNVQPSVPSTGNQNKTYTGVANTTAITATPAAGETIDWYANPSGGTALAIGNTSYTPVAINAGIYTYYAEARNTTSGCLSSSRKAVTLIINVAPLTITANNTNKVYGSTLVTGSGNTNFTSSGLQNGETIGSVTMTYGTGAAATDIVGTTGSSTSSAATGGTFTASNYSITYVSGTITVVPATLVITANNVNKNYGDVLNGSSTYTGFTSSGLQNGETIGSVTFTPGAGKNATDTVGTYYGQAMISVAIGGTFNPSNYNISYVAGDIIVATVIAMWSPQGGSTDWSDPANWTNGITPDQYKSALISADSTPYPILTADASVYGLDIQGNATVSIDQYTLNIFGPVSSDTGTITASSTGFDGNLSTCSIVIAGAAGNLKFTTGAQTLYNLTLLDSSSATLATPLNIAAGNYSTAGTLNIGNNAMLNTGNQLTLKSDDFNTAQVGPVGSGSSIIGDVTVERYIRSFFNAPYSSDGNNITDPAKRAWRLMTAPVSGDSTIFATWQDHAPVYDPLVNAGRGTLITGPGANKATNGLDGGINSNYSLKTFDQATSSLINVANTLVPISGNSGSADNKPYFIFVRGDRDTLTIGNPDFGGVDINNTTLSATGKLQTGTQVFNVQSSPDTAHKKFAMIGNPYVSPVDLRQVNFTNIAPFVYTWDPGLNQVGGYVTLDGIHDYAVSSPSSGSNQNQYIQSSQAFLVFGGLSSAGASSVTFTENSKASIDSAGNNNLVFRPASVEVSFRTDLYLVNSGKANVLADGNLVEYDNAYCSCVDFFDAPKLPNINETFGLSRNGSVLSIERRPVIVNSDTLFLNLTKSTQRNYAFSFIPASMSQSGLKAFLKDSYLNDSTALSLTDTTTVAFSIDANAASQTANRFMVVFEPTSVLPVTYTNVKAYQQNGGVSVEWSVTNQLNISAYEVEKSIDGITFTKVATVKASDLSNAYNWIDENAISGDNYYRICSVVSNGAVQYSAVVKVKTGTSIPSITVYPNPIRGGVISLQMVNMAKGKYDIQLIDNIGQVLMSTEIEHAGGSSNQIIRYKNNLTKGVYHLEVNGPDNYKNDIKVMY